MLAGLLTAVSSLFVVAGGVWIRFILAIVIAALLVTLVLTRPAFGITATFVYLVFLAMVRRMLLPAAPWISADPLLIVGPLVAVVLLVKAFVLDSRRWAPDLISKLVVVLLAVTLAEAFNPGNGGLSAGISGLMFMAVPLLWFFVGREFLTDADVDRLLKLVVVLGTFVALYGLWQTQVGDLPWDAAWLRTTAASAYSSLDVNGTVRSFGTFSSFNEYGLFIGASLAIAVSLCLRGRLIFVLPVPLLAVALFLASGRSALITVALALVVMLGLRTGRPATALLVTVLAVGAAFVGLKFGGSALSSAGSGSSALVSHQIGGLTNPLDPSSSTLLIHLQLVYAGVKASLSHPLGQGTAVTNQAAGLSSSNRANNTQLDVLGAGSSATDFDISNAFVSLGFAGGLLYVASMVVILATAIRSYFRGQRQLLPIIGLLIVDVGQWMSGGAYALSALIWVLIGVVAASSMRVTTPRGSPFTAGAMRLPE